MSRKNENVGTNSTEEATDEDEESKESEEVEETTEEAEEEEKAERRKELKEDIAEERVYTIPLGKAWISPRKKRAPRAVRILRGFIDRHMKPESIVIADEVNERIWRRGIEKPPRRIRVRAVKDLDGRVSIHLAEAD